MFAVVRQSIFAPSCFNCNGTVINSRRKKCNQCCGSEIKEIPCWWKYKGFLNNSLSTDVLEPQDNSQLFFIINFDLTCDLYSVVLSEVVFPLERLLQKGTADTEEEWGWFSCVSSLFYYWILPLGNQNHKKERRKVGM